MLRRYRFALGPGWIALHLLTLALAVTMVLLGRWQLHVSEAKHFSLQNFGYALQWWAFSLFTVALWARVLRDHTRRGPSVDACAAAEVPAPPEEPVTYRRYVMPSGPRAVDDPEVAAYNDYLARLADEAADPRRTTP